MATIECQKAEITAKFDGETQIEITVPAYTRTYRDMEFVTKEYLYEYLDRSGNHNAAVSIADFAFYLLSQAVLEPTVMEDEE